MTLNILKSAQFPDLGCFLLDRCSCGWERWPRQTLWMGWGDHCVLGKLELCLGSPGGYLTYAVLTPLFWQHVPVSTSSHMHSFPWCCWWFSKFISSVDYLSWVCRSQNAEFIYLECFHWLLLRHSFLPPPTLLSAPRSSSRKSLLCSSVRCVCVTFGEGGENILDSIYI